MVVSFAIHLPISWRRTTVPRNTTSGRPSTAGVQNQNRPASPTPDEKAAELLLKKARSHMQDDEARRVASSLEELSDPHRQISLDTRTRCFQGLVELCGEYRFLPESYLIPESQIVKLGDLPISAGGSSEVWRGIYEEKPVAIKVFEYYERDGPQKIEKNFYREAITLKIVSHPNILKLIGVMADNGSYAIVVPWMQNRDIMSYVRKEPQTNRLKLLEDAALGLQYLHNMNLAHGDFKGKNILISEGGCAYLADLGLTRVVGDLSPDTTSSDESMRVGRIAARWCAPELLQPERFGLKGNGPTKKADVYSLAMAIYQILTDRVPYYDCSMHLAMLRIIEGVRPEKPDLAVTRGYTEDLWKMTISCWNEAPTERPTVDQVLEELKIAKEQWEPQLPSLPSQDD